MKSNAPWSVKGIARDARDTAKAAAQREGLTVGEWLNQTIQTAGDGDAPPSQGDIDGLKARDLAAAIEHLSRRIAGAETKSANAVEALARSVGGAVERLQRLERGSASEGVDLALQTRVAALEERTAGQQRIEALRALEKAVAQVAVQFNTAQQSTVARLDAAERQLRAIAARPGRDADGVSAAAVRDAIEGMAARIARAEKIAAEAAKLKSEAAETVDSDFIQKTGIRLRILGDEIKRGGDQMRTLESTIARLSQQIDGAEKRSAEGVAKVAETIIDLRTQFANADAADQASARAGIDAAVSEISQRTEDRIQTLQNSFEAMTRRLETAGRAEPKSAPTPEVAAAAPAAAIGTDLDAELDDAFAALDLEEPIASPAAAEAVSAEADDEIEAEDGFDFDEERDGDDASLDSETQDVLAEIREAFGIEPAAKPADDVAEEADANAPEEEVEQAASLDPPPVAEAAVQEQEAEADSDYLKAARRAAREAAAKAAAEELSPAKRKLTPKQRAILAARIKKRKLEEANAKAAAEALVATPPDSPEPEVDEEPAASVKARVAALVAKIKSRPAQRDEGATLDAPGDEPAPGGAPSLIAGAESLLRKLGKIPNAGGIFGLAAVIVLLIGASFILFKDMFSKAQKPEPIAASETPAERIAPATAEATVNPRQLYLANIGALKTAETDAAARSALVSIEQAAALGHPPAQLQIGELHKLGQLYERDLAAARLWFERAAHGGNVLAMHRLGVMAARGEGGPIDPATSIRWFEQASAFGLVDSQYNLGATYHPTADGAVGGVQDRAKAYFWYSIAAKNSDAQAGELAAGLAASMPAAERATKDAEVEAWAAKSPDPVANELAAS